MLTDRVLAGVIALAKARGVPVIVDPKRRDFTAYRGATYLKPNRAELHLATGLPVATDADIERAGTVAAAAADAAILARRPACLWYVPTAPRITCRPTPSASTT
jgi:D-beta-D-heptose 7-phosphate kinase/D-beta-D-heptose 1-phosphate adenosyltransferase